MLERNPNYHGSRPHQLDANRARASASPRQKAVPTGRGRARGLRRRRHHPGDGSQARRPLRAREARPRRKGKQQYFLNALPGLDYSCSTPTGRSSATCACARRSTTRSTAAHWHASATSLVRFRARPTDQYLPPGMPGFTDVRIYPFSPMSQRRGDWRAGSRERCPLHLQPVAVRPDRPDRRRPTWPRSVSTSRSRRSPSGSFRAAGQEGRALRPRLDRLDRRTTRIRPTSSTSCSSSGLDSRHSTTRRTGASSSAAAELSGPPRYLAYGKLDADLARNVRSVGCNRQPAESRLLLAAHGLPGLQPSVRDGPRRTLHPQEELDGGRAPQRHCHLPLHRHRGLDSAPEAAGP